MPEGMHGRDVAMERLGQPSLIDDFHVFLASRGSNSRRMCSRGYRQEIQPNEKGQDLLVHSPSSGWSIFELMLDIDEGFGGDTVMSNLFGEPSAASTERVVLRA